MTTKILAIDDSKTMRLAIKITFAAEDADVTSVSKGSDAAARAKQMGANVVLVDASLAAAEPSGYDVCHAIKSDKATAGIPVIVLVSNQTGVDQARLTEVGGDDWIAKPFESQELIDKVAAVCAKESAKPTAAAAAAPPKAEKPVAAPPRAASGPKPAAKKPAPAAKPRAANRTQMGMPSPASPNKTAASTPVMSKPPTSRPAAKPAAKPARSAPPSKPAARPAAAAKGGAIPIAIPIPFTAADAPTAGMVERIQQAAGAGTIDPRVAEAIAALSREVVERVVWEVVPELAEVLIKEKSA